MSRKRNNQTQTQTTTGQTEMSSDQEVIENENTGDVNTGEEQNTGAEGSTDTTAGEGTETQAEGSVETETTEGAVTEEQPPVANEESVDTAEKPAEEPVEQKQPADTDEGKQEETPKDPVAPAEEPKAEKPAKAPTAPAVVAPAAKTAPKDEVIELPVAKARAGTKTTITKNTDVPKQSVGLDKITVEELIKRKHDFNLNEASGDLKEVLDFFDRYEDSMKSALEVGDTVGESLQKQMYKTYLRVLSLDTAKDRDVAMEVLLWKFYKDAKGAYGVTQMGRFTRNGRWHTQELNMYLQMNHIFYSVRNPLDRIQRLRDFKLSAIVSAFPADKVRYTENFLNWATSIR